MLLNMEDEKKISITGTSNRYQINKLKKEDKVTKIRKAAEKMSLPEDLSLIHISEPTRPY